MPIKKKTAKKGAKQPLTAEEKTKYNSGLKQVNGKFVAKVSEEDFVEALKTMSQAEMATHFGITRAAVSYRLKKLQTREETSRIATLLTPKEQVFVKALVDGETKTGAALIAYDTLNKDSASAIAQNLLKEKKIQYAIQDLLEVHGIGANERVSRLRELMSKKEKSEVAIRALDMAFKLADDYPAQKSVKLNVNLEWSPVDLSEYVMKPPTEVENIENSQEDFVEGEVEE